MSYTYKTALKINKTADVCFDAVVNPDVLNTYFTTTTSGPLEAGKTITWNWDQADCDGDTHDVDVIERVDNKMLQMAWTNDEVETQGKFKFTFEENDKGQTLVTLEETWPETPAGLNMAFECCQGWTHMLMCMRARLDHGIDLRFTN